jgi:peptidoglycan/LPS O-acetylase OafA/YrhL
MPASKSNRIATLDGWRCVSIFLVLFTHYQSEYLGRYFNSNWTVLGIHGVTVFFVISGYLITSGFINGSYSSLKEFYTKRFFRLMPAAWSYLLLLSVLAFVTTSKVSIALAGCMLFYRNYVNDDSHNRCTSHFWSLSIEEQFYLFWPILLIRLGRRGALIFAALAIACLSVYRTIRWESYSSLTLFHRSEVRIDSILFGCLLALVLEYGRVKSFITRHAPWIFALSASLFIADTYFYHVLVPAHECLAIALMIGSTSLRPRMIVSRFLELKPLKFIGQISYGIYLWQQTFLTRGWGYYGFVFLAMFVLVSYFYIELPLIALGKKIVSRHVDKSRRVVLVGS